MEEYIQERTVLESELEECIWEYYRQTAPSLQEFYSRYTPNGKSSTSTKPCRRPIS